MIGNYIKKVINEKGNIEITFEISENGSKMQTNDIKKDETYLIEFKDIKQKRTLNQNAFMWKCLELIAEKELNGRTDSDYVEILYSKMLEKSGAKYEYIMAMTDTIPELKKVFRAVRIMEYRDYNDKRLAVLKCYYGSSKMNTKEMRNLIETILDYASNIGLYIDSNYLEELF